MRNTTLNYLPSPLYVFSDLDGTLGIEGQGIPPRNRIAIQSFVRRGGKFGICTGRSPESAVQFLGDIPVSLPSIVCGGCALYDFSTHHVWNELFLEESSLGFAFHALEQFPLATLLAVNRQGYFQISPQNFLGTYPYCPVEKLERPLYRLILSDLPARTPLITQRMLSLAPPGVRIERTAPDFVEIMSAQAGKWPAMRRLCAQLGISLAQVVFLGDFYNDIELLQNIGLGACVGDAPSSVQGACTLVLPPCMQGAIEPLLQQIQML